MDKFCYLGDILSVDGDAHAAVDNRIQIRWNTVKQSVPMLTNNNISLIVRGRLYSSCVQSSILHGSETWPIRKENEMALQHAGMRMVLSYRVPSKGLREGLDDIIFVLQ